MGAVVFCNIAWMKNYRGITDEDQPYNGGSFVKENNDAMERINFLPINGKCYGFVMHRGQLHIERLDRTAIKTNVLDDVTVVWVATDDKSRKIVGWYENAEMYTDWQTYEDNQGYIEYNFCTKADNAYLIPAGLRDFSIESASQAGKGRGMGQSNVWYADSEFGQRLVPKVLKYLGEMKQKCRIVGFTLEELKKPTQIPNKTSEELLDMAYDAFNSGEYLKSLQICNQAQSVEESPYGKVRECRGSNLEMLFCYDAAIEAYKDALTKITDEEYDAWLDVVVKGHLSRLYRLIGRNFLAWHMEEEIFVANQEDKNNAGMVGSLLEMMSIAEEEKDFDRLKKLIATFDDIGTKYCADDVDYYRGVLKKKG